MQGPRGLYSPRAAFPFPGTLAFSALPKERPTSGEPVLPAALAHGWALRTPGLQDGVARATEREEAYGG